MSPKLWNLTLNCESSKMMNGMSLTINGFATGKKYEYEESGNNRKFPLQVLYNSL